jgi:cytochrome c oxidase subunit 4
MSSHAPIPDNVAHGHSQPLPHHKVNYFAIFGLLVMLTIVTVAAAFANFQSEFLRVMVALAIASIKASFVALYFMHLKFEGKLIYFIIGIPLCMVVIVVCALIPDVIMPALHGWQLGRPNHYF